MLIKHISKVTMLQYIQMAGKSCEMNVIKFRDDTMVRGTIKRTLNCSVIDLDSDLWCDKFEL